MRARRGFAFSLGFVCVMGPLLVIAGSATGASVPASWHVAGRLPASSLTGVACPSVSLCVAVDTTGDVLSSTSPAAGARAWTKVTIDASTALTAVTCPSTGLCVAVDGAGNLATSTDPAEGSWTVSNLEGANRFVGVVCPSTSVCVAATTTDLLVSRDPAAGSSSWTITRDADTATGPECGKYGGDSGCAETMLILSCGSSSFCSAVDGDGGMVAGDPLTGTWISRGGPGLDVEGLACRADGMCLTLCAVGSGLGGGECTATQYDATSLCADAGCFTISNQQGSGLWCPGFSICFAATGNGELIASTRPTTGTTAWSRVYVDPNGQSVTGLSCPRSTLCIAVNSAGQVLLGAELPTARQIARLISQQLRPPRTQARPTTLLKRDGCRYAFSSPSAARLTISWKAVGRIRSHSVIAWGAATFRSSGTTKIRLVLTSAGRRLLRHAPSVKVAANARLTGAGAATITAAKTFSLTH